MALLPDVIPIRRTGRQSPGLEIPGGLREPVRPEQPDLKLPTEILQNRYYTDFLAKLKGGAQLGVEQQIKQILFFTEVDFLLHTFSPSSMPRVVTVGTTPVNVISRLESMYPRGYLVLNPAEISGFSTTVTFYASALRANGFVTPSTSFNVTGVNTVRTWLDITATAGASPTLTVNAQTQDPLTGNWATAQSDIYGGAVTVGTFYAAFGEFGVDRLVRLLATVGDAVGESVTFSISGLLKGGTTSPVGSTIFLGGDANVNTTMGYRLLPGAEKALFMKENGELWARTALDTMNLLVYALQ